VGVADLPPTGPIGLDTSIFIYLIEEHPEYFPLVLPLFRDADRGRRELVTSALTLHEVLVVPLRAGNRMVADQYELLLTRGRGVRTVDITPTQVRAAAQLRAALGVRTPDALQLVAAVSAGCSTFLTDDRRLPNVPGLRIVQLAG
jgi:predicted nucleic acid-binding protein